MNCLHSRFHLSLYFLGKFRNISIRTCHLILKPRQLITDIIEVFLFLDGFLLNIINTVYYLVKVYADGVQFSNQTDGRSTISLPAEA